MTTTQTAPRRAVRRTPTLHTVRHLARRQAEVAVWFFGILILAATLAVVVWDRIGTVDQSIVQFARQGAMIWFPFSLAVITATTYLGVHVASGMTRRAFASASLIVAVGTAAGYAAVLTALLQTERLVFAVLGMEHGVAVGSALFTDSSQVGLIALDFLGVILAGQLSGLLCGVVYYRAGGWWGTVALPLTVGPVFLVLWLLGTDWLVAIEPRGAAFALDLLWRGALVVGVLALVAGAYAMLVRRASIAAVRP